jgi:hypothetical protein
MGVYMKFKLLILMGLLGLYTNLLYASSSEMTLAPSTSSGAKGVAQQVKAVTECGSVLINFPQVSGNHIVSGNNSTDTNGSILYQFLYFATTPFATVATPSPATTASQQGYRLCAGGLYQVTINVSNQNQEPAGHWQRQQFQLWGGANGATSNGNTQFAAIELDPSNEWDVASGSISYLVTVPPLATSTSPYYLYFAAYDVDSGDNHTNFYMYGYNTTNSVNGSIVYLGNGIPW